MCSLQTRAALYIFEANIAGAELFDFETREFLHFFHFFSPFFCSLPHKKPPLLVFIIDTIIHPPLPLGCAIYNTHKAR